MLRETQTCERCGKPMRPISGGAAQCAELLGFYLGDGHISSLARTQRLRVSLDAAYPGVVDRVFELLRRIFSRQRVGVLSADAGSTAVVYVYSNHLSCLLPQHGRGQKHRRAIRLQPWQEEQVATAPWALLRGLLWSDGCFFVNRTGRYAYLSVDFASHSADILDLYCRTCDRLGIAHRRYARNVRIYRRDAVALVEQHVGLKM